MAIGGKDRNDQAGGRLFASGRHSEAVKRMVAAALESACRRPRRSGTFEMRCFAGEGFRCSTIPTIGRDIEVPRNFHVSTAETSGRYRHNRSPCVESESKRWMTIVPETLDIETR